MHRSSRPAADCTWPCRRRGHARPAWWRWVVVVLAVMTGRLIGGHAGVRAADTCTDTVHLAGRGELRGAVLDRRPDGGLTVAVRRSWLRDHASAEVDRLAAEDRRLAAAARDDVSRRIERLLDADGEKGTRRGDLLERERARLRAARDDDSEFAILDLAPRAVRRVIPANPADARLARWGWHEGLDDVEALSARRLRAALVEAGVDPDGEPPDLADRLPPRPQDDREWHARLALVDQALGTPVTFQGVGSTVVRVGDGDAGLADIVRLLPQLLAGGEAGGGLLGDLLADLAPEAAGARGDDWLAVARSQAPEGRFRATRVRPDVGAGRATVESVFQVRLPDGTWATAWRDTATAGGGDAPPGAADRILADPRVKPLLEGLRALGIADDATIEKAVAVGVATLAAQQASDARFAALQSDVLRRLDIPRLDMSAE